MVVPEDDRASQAWVEEASQILEPQAVGHYVASVDLIVDGAARARVFADDKLRRLRETRATWDPAELFFGLPTPDDF
jgi:hypothetical protein